MKSWQALNVINAAAKMQRMKAERFVDGSKGRMARFKLDSGSAGLKIFIGQTREITKQALQDFVSDANRSLENMHQIARAVTGDFNVASGQDWENYAFHSILFDNISNYYHLVQVDLHSRMHKDIFNFTLDAPPPSAREYAHARVPNINFHYHPFEANVYNAYRWYILRFYNRLIVADAANYDGLVNVWSDGEVVETLKVGDVPGEFREYFLHEDEIFHPRAMAILEPVYVSS